MGILSYFERKRSISVVESYKDEFLTEKVGSISIPDTLTDANAFMLANSVAEIYFPIDFLADRASKLRYYIADRNGIEIPPTSELNRFIDNINPLYSFSDLIYQAVFSMLSDGNLIQYVAVPQSYRNVSINNITRLDVLQPNQVSFREYTNVSELTATSLTDFIKEARYLSTNDSYYDPLRVDRLRIFRYDATKREKSSSVLARSPLFKSFRSINLLLAVYSARYNVYVNNGAAGYLVKKSANGGIEASLADRDQILRDINERSGLTGNRRLWGISSVPLEWVNTLSTIKDLIPLEETLENAIKIASTFQIPPELVPRKDQSTFDNKAVTERSVWENTLMSLVDSIASYFTKSLTLDQSGYKIMADYRTVSALKANETEIEAKIQAKITNLKALKELYPDAKIDNEITKILQSYEGR